MRTFKKQIRNQNRADIPVGPPVNFPHNITEVNFRDDAPEPETK